MSRSGHSGTRTDFRSATPGGVVPVLVLQPDSVDSIGEKLSENRTGVEHDPQAVAPVFERFVDPQAFPAVFAAEEA